MISKCDKIQGDRKLTNHSVRKHLMQKCNDLGLPTNCTIQLGGHRNVGSANSYSKINDKQQKLISSALTKSPSTFASSENRALVPSNSLNHTYATLTEPTNNIEPPAILAPSPNNNKIWLFQIQLEMYPTVTKQPVQHHKCSQFPKGLQ